MTWRDANEIGQAINRFRFFGRPVTVGYASGRTVYKYSSAPVPATLSGPTAAPARGQHFESLEPLQARGSVRVPVDVPANATRLAVWVWDRFGELVRTLVDEPHPRPGSRSLEWDRTDDAGNSLPPGHFIWRVLVGGTAESRLVRVS